MSIRKNQNPLHIARSLEVGGSQSLKIRKEQEVDRKINRAASNSVFHTVIVTEFISNPFIHLSSEDDTDMSNSKGNLRSQALGVQEDSSSSDEDKTLRNTYKRGYKKVLNPSSVDTMPRNSIIGHRLGESIEHAEVFFPFFSSHFSMPVKAGEQVWVIYDKIGANAQGYWISRKSGTVHTEDVNYTDGSGVRQILASGLIDNTKLDSQATPLKIDTLERLWRFDNPLNMSSPNGDSPIDHGLLCADSITYNEHFVGEAVPRFDKNCCDFTLQGSNNTLITMSHEPGVVNSGLIKLVAGRGMNGGEKGSLIYKVKNKRKAESKSYEYNENALKCEDLLKGTADQISGLGDKISTGYESTIDRNYDPTTLELYAGQGQGAFILTTNVSTSRSEDGDPGLDAPLAARMSTNDAIEKMRTTIKARTINLHNEGTISTQTSEETTGDTTLITQGVNSTKDIVLHTNNAGVVYLQGSSPGGADQPYIRYDEFKTLIDTISDQIDSLRTAVNTFCTTQTAAISAAGGAPGGYAGLATGYTTLTGQTAAPKKPNISPKIPPCASKRIFGE